MSGMTLSQAATIMDAHVVGDIDGIAFNGASIDSRTTSPENLFFAFRGEQVDAHTLIPHWDSAFSAAIVVEEKVDHALPQLIVKNTHQSLIQLACHARKKYSGKVIALTGSNGKTTAKEMIADVIAKKYSVSATKGNFNNDIGLPLTLLAHQNEACMILEMGANHQHEIELLTDIAKPDVALITNAAEVHIEGFGSIEGVAKGKGEIFNGLLANGIAILNADDAYYKYWLSLLKPTTQVITFGEAEGADVQILSSCPAKLSVRGHSYDCKLALLGKHNVMNACAAIAVGMAMGIEVPDALEALSSMKPVAGRLQTIFDDGQHRLINDSYNANPVSFQAAIDVLEALSGNTILVLGDMAELGDDSMAYHEQVIAAAEKSNIDIILTLGKRFMASVDGSVGRACAFDSMSELTQYLSEQLDQCSATVIVKGSRSMQMEKVFDGLAQTTKKGGTNRVA